jgi:hypothetical protein
VNQKVPVASENTDDEDPLPENLKRIPQEEGTANCESKRIKLSAIRQNDIPTLELGETCPVSYTDIPSPANENNLTGLVSEPNIRILNADDQEENPRSPMTSCVEDRRGTQNAPFGEEAVISEIPRSNKTSPEKEIKQEFTLRRSPRFNHCPPIACDSGTGTCLDNDEAEIPVLKMESTLPSESEYPVDTQKQSLNFVACKSESEPKMNGKSRKSHKAAKETQFQVPLRRGRSAAFWAPHEGDEKEEEETDISTNGEFCVEMKTHSERSPTPVVDDQQVPQAPQNLRIKQVGRTRKSTMAPEVPQAPQAAPATTAGNEGNASPGPRGEFAHFDTIEESIADKLKYQWEYATARNLLRGNAERALAEERAKRRATWTKITLTEEEYISRLLKCKLLRWKDCRADEIRYLQLNVELKESMQLDNINLDKCYELLEELDELTRRYYLAVKYPDLLNTLQKIMCFPDERIILKAEEVFHQYLSCFGIPEFKTFDDVLLDDAKDFQACWAAACRKQKVDAEKYKWQTINFEEFKINLQQLPEHIPDSESESEEDWIPVPRSKLPRSAKKPVSYQAVVFADDSQVVPGDTAELSEDNPSDEDYQQDDADDFFL